MKLAEKIFKRKDYYVTSPFGYRINPITGEKGEFHDGVDYGTNAQKWPQYAIENGKVISCGVDTAYNNAKFVWVQYDRLGIKLLHYHLDSVQVSKGQIVNESTVLGTTGKTGNATGIHLHLGMKYLNSNAYIDAEAYDYKPAIEIVPVGRDLTKHQVEITISNLNARDAANGNLLGIFVPKGIYYILNEQTVGNTRWVEINEGVWCALLDKCFVEYMPEEKDDYKALYEEATKEIKSLKDDIAAIKAIVDKYK